MVDQSIQMNKFSQIELRIYLNLQRLPSKIGWLIYLIYSLFFNIRDRMHFGFLISSILAFTINTAALAAAQFTSEAPLTSELVFTHAERNCIAALSGERMDPYYLANGNHLAVPVKDLEIEFPRLQGVNDDPLLGFKHDILRNQKTLATRSAILRAEDYAKQKGPDGKGATHTFRIAEHLGAFEVFVTYPPHPNDPHPMQNWILENGQLVLKSIIMCEENCINNNLSNILRTWTALEYLSQITPHIKFRGLPLLDVARIHVTAQSASTGVLEQQYAYGPSVHDLQQAITSTVVILESGRAIESDEFLKSWGLNKADAHLLQPMLDALEETYRRLQAWGTKQPLLEPLDNVANWVEDKPVSVLFDFNHGRNIIYDIRLKRFVVIDG